MYLVKYVFLCKIASSMYEELLETEKMENLG